MAKTLNNKFVWDKVYNSEKDIIVLESEAFNSDRWLNQILGQLTNYKLRKENLPPRSTDLPVIAKAVEASTILDFGGSNGWTFEFIARSSPQYFESINNYIIYEKPEVCCYFEKKKIHKPPLNYISTLESIKTVEIFYSNSAIQYLLNESLLNECIKKAKPKLILFENVLCGDFKDYYTLQNYYEYKIPVKFRSKEVFINNLEKLGYTLTLQKVYSEPIKGIIDKFDMSNFPKELRIDYGLTMLFEKI